MSANIADLIKSSVTEARDAMLQAAREVIRLRTRCEHLEMALNRMVCAHENLEADTEGKYPPPDSGCVECTLGSVPNRYNTGLCAFHNAKRVLGQTS